MKIKIAFSCLLYAVFSVIVNAQELPPIKTFTPQEYGAEDQNWGISQAQNNVLYFANNKGLLEYNGSRWQLYRSPNESILRSVKVINDKVYTGFYMDFGYWMRNNFGQLTYTSLKDQLKLNISDDEEFWQIIELEHWVLFQSFESIYIYNTKNNTVNTITSDTRINKIFKTDDTIYFQKLKEGIFKIENGNPVLLIDNAVINNLEIINIYNISDYILLQTKDSGFYTFKNNTLKKWDISANPLLQNASVYSSIKLKDGSFLLGTISKGIYHISTNGDVLFHINQSNGLTNNTVLSVFEDNDGNIWLGLDNGINIININSPIKVYRDSQGVLGTIYASAKTKDYLYLGTNQGLFYKSIHANTPFRFIANTKGQVWDLKLIDGTLFCGHDNGTFIIDNINATKISNIKGTWCLRETPNNPNLILQGNYKGLSVLEKNNKNVWSLKHKISGFDISSRYLEFSDPHKILVSHEYKGVYHINLNENYTKVENFKKDTTAVKGYNSSISKYNGAILYVNKTGVFKYSNNSNSFIKDTLLSKEYSNSNYVSGKLITDNKTNKVWVFTKNEITYLEPGKLTSEPKITKVYLPSELRKNKSGYENVLNLNDNTYLIGTREGYLVLNTDKIITKPQSVQLNNVYFDALHKDKIALPLQKEVTLKNKDNNIGIYYSVAQFNSFSKSLFQYKLEGIYNNWSDWSEKPNVYFENLPPGEYKFFVRAKVGNNPPTDTAVYRFNIENPWYKNTWAIITYIIIFFFITFLIQYFNRRYYKKQKQKLIVKKEKELALKELESQKKIIQYKNDKLQHDIENKNRELGLSTMNLIKKNELLNAIKKELNNTKQIEDLKAVVKLINKNLNTTDDWKLFEEAFNNADKNFLKKIKSKHPLLTPNDLRLCAYLRLNLSSKEIAPLLSISPRSVEVKRYRLRKKLELTNQTSLTDYILNT